MKQVKILENVTNRAGPETIPLGLLKLRHLLTCEQDAARIRPENAGDQVQEGRFSRSTLALQGDVRFRCHGEIIHIDDSLLAAVRADKRLFELRDFEQGHKRFKAQPWVWAS